MRVDNILEGCGWYIPSIDADSRRIRYVHSLLLCFHSFSNLQSAHSIPICTQIIWLGGGFFGLIHPFLVADLTFGTGRFNVVMGLTASCFGLGATLSNFIGQHLVENFGHVTSLMGSLLVSIVPIFVFGCYMPETLGDRGSVKAARGSSSYVVMAEWK